MEHRFENSVGGDELRQIPRRQEEREAESDLFSSALSAAALASAGVTVLSRFASRSSARRSSVGRRSSVYSRTSSTSSPKSAAPISSSSDPFKDAISRVKSVGFRFSTTQPRTRGDGNCMIHAIMDQLKKRSHPVLDTVVTPHDLRLFICSNLNRKYMMETILGDKYITRSVA